eukprot:TRINITY_DN5949_c0_g1_i3.p1 TRINITY_DN5949_c0_g1~~TRINITY_DN5949_c0_g1_i3.p1  ORF type:complete len:251 (-),score=7.17 TRINITY_DN5949_c0_g1_i3:63-773(-)
MGKMMAQEYVGDDGNQVNMPAEPMIVRDSHLSIVVDDLETPRQAITAKVKEFGGYVVASTQYQESSLSLQLRVPVDKLDLMVSIVKEMATKVYSFSMNGRDVTEEWIDAAGRVQSLNAARDKLYKLMEMASQVHEVLAIQREINSYTMQLEQAEGRKGYLEKSSKLSSLNIDMQTEKPYAPPSSSWNPAGAFFDALKMLGTIFKTSVLALIWIAVLGTPLLIIFCCVYFIRKRTDQ